MKWLFTPSERAVGQAFQRLATRLLLADRVMPGGDATTRMKHHFHLMRGTIVSLAAMGVIVLAANVRKDNVDPKVPATAIAMLATSLALTRRFNAERQALPKVLREWHTGGPEALRKKLNNTLN